MSGPVDLAKSARSLVVSCGTVAARGCALRSRDLEDDTVLVSDPLDPDRFLLLSKGIGGSDSRGFACKPLLRAETADRPISERGALSPGGAVFRKNSARSEVPVFFNGRGASGGCKS